MYLRGYVEELEDGEARLILGDGVRLSRCYLRKILRRAQKTQQIVILDLVNYDYKGFSAAENWIEDLQCGTEYGQCLIVTQTSIDKSEAFSQTVLESLANVNPQMGLPVAKWIIQLQQLLQLKGINLHSWLSGTQAIIDILPGNISQVFQDFPQIQAQQTVVQFPVKSIAQPQKQLNLNSEQYSELEKLLKQSIGIIAPTILQKSIKQAANHQELIEKITAYISLQQKTEFKNRANAILEAAEVPTIPAQYNLAKSPAAVYPAIDQDFIKKCERELTYLIGPMANFIIEETLKSYPQISMAELVDKLAQNIPDSAMTIEFKQRVLDK